MFEITPLLRNHVPAAADLFARSYHELRREVPALPDDMESSDHVAELVRGMVEPRGLAALQAGRLVGYLGWYLVDDFRGTRRKAAYCPEWAHAAVGQEKPGIYRAIYREAAGLWLEAGCSTHAISLLAHEKAALETWFWSGFGLTVVDAIRALPVTGPEDPLGLPIPRYLVVRKAEAADVSALVEIDAEHYRHYSEPPVLMANPEPRSASDFARRVSDPQESVWLAFLDGDLAGFMTFSRASFGAANIVQSLDTIAIDGAYVRPDYRGRGVARALLGAALRDYSERGYRSCSVDFESLNPEAASFWPKYFQLVCLSLTRVPERQPG